MCSFFSAVCILVLLQISHTAANGGDPTITLAAYKGQGIGLTCSSEGWYPRPQALWLDSRGENRTEKSAIANTETIAGIFRVFGSITLEPGVDSTVSCKIINNLVKSERESRILISDVFYPTTSLWTGPFITILVLFSCVTAFVTYKWIQSFREVSKFEKEAKEMKSERDREKNAIEIERMTDKGELSEIRKSSERCSGELALRRAQSHAVAVYLDSDCKHPDITITKDGRAATLNAKSAVGSLVVVGKEGYVAGKHYWEVKVGDWLDWELGVLTQGERDRTRKEMFSVPLGEERWALKSVRGHLFSNQNEEKIEKKQDNPYSYIGLFLDQESGTIYFYRACTCAPLLITTITIQSTEKLYPFLSFGECDLGCVQDALEVIHMKIPLPFQKFFKK
ncbi:butyrophilin subfamily 3 member A1-like isoform X2 [Python bivittatus]|uniref:Butyrophilin subfamily 3 member A1-like isoform X2 n=1 Tax=Python bivittatus TaxID=176946 RepID=A0A9F5INR0_PYTBI|nr:butyrophilin subfamily 3 member A1-like isoform X2 [Python bivittatus]XP_025028751.1 butyrophilin subfamily 3 member A1-like isoform X2 [Python bivittatus]